MTDETIWQPVYSQIKYPMSTCKELLDDALLTCSNCQRTFYSNEDNPKAIILPCLDILCSVCLTNVKDSGSAQCPLNLCAKETAKASLQIDNTIRDIQTFLEAKKERPVCTECQSGEMAHHYCPKCEGYLCTSRCLDAHRKIKFFSSHKPVSLDDDISNLTKCIERKCEIVDHEDKKTIFCSTCGKSICLKCEKRDHRDHELRNLSEMYVDSRARLETSLSDVSKRLSEADEILDTINKDNLIKNRLRAQDNLKNKSEKTQRLMTARKQNIDEKIQEDYHAKRNVLEQRFQLFKSKANLESCVRFLRYTLKYKDDSGLLDVSHVSQEQAHVLKNQTFGDIGSDELSYNYAIEELVDPLIHAPSTTLTCVGPAVAGQPHRFCLQLKNTKGRIMHAKDLDVFILVTFKGRTVNQVMQPTGQNRAGHLKVNWKPPEAGEYKIAVLLFMGAVEIWSCLLTVYQQDEHSSLESATRGAQVCENRRRTSSQTSTGSENDICPDCDLETFPVVTDQSTDDGGTTLRPHYEYHPDISAHIGIGGIYSTGGVCGINYVVPHSTDFNRQNTMYTSVFAGQTEPATEEKDETE